MTDVPVRELRNNTADVIRRVQGGDDVTITSNGVAIATLVPISTGRRSAMPRREFIRGLRGHQADPDLRRDLADFAGDTTDDLGPIR
ncbi:MAG: type II toxin-antitoxin system prevent-host-death family antitoxin [Pseudolysinimonas sp.]|jgi:prevent-host-death family protein|uniref:type II toxin-antitoxin system Phd/YefM family antitoxin n=1 Tax=Pseudolysinimonas sp. TaxID=2680009 RepID=UPI003C73190B